MLPRKTASMALVLLLTASSFTALLPAAGPRAGATLTVTQEWQGGPYNATPTTMVNDTDGDGQNELVVYLNSFVYDPGGKQELGEHWIKVYDLPGYKEAWSLDLNGSFGLELLDAGQNGSVQLLLSQSDENGTWFELYSGKGFGKLWTSDRYANGITGQQTADVDADKDLEMAFANGSMVIDGKMNFTYEYFLQVLNLKSGKGEWESPAIDKEINNLYIANIDGDPALELMAFLDFRDENFSARYGLQAYDGASYKLQWELAADPTTSGLSLLGTGNFDGDRNIELLLDIGRSNDTASSEGFLMLTGSDGATEWGLDFENASLSMQTADIDNDTLDELLVTESVTDPDFNTNTTFRIFDLKARKEAWSMGPFASPLYSFSISAMTASDLTGDGVPEIVIVNSTFDIVNGSFSQIFTILVIDGITFDEKWQSPTFHGGYPYPLALDQDPDWELFIAESWQDGNMNLHGFIHVFDTNTWTLEWSSKDYGTRISGSAFDAVNDSRPEMLITEDVEDTENLTTLQKLQIIDADTHAVEWTSPAVSQVEYDFQDLYGSPRNEIVFLVPDSDGTGQMPTQTTQLIVFNDTTYVEAWRSDKLDGYGYFEHQGDFDNDGRGELMLATRVDNIDRTTATNLTVFEFVEKTPDQADLAIGPGDLTLSNPTPQAGTRITLTALVHNLGAAAANCSTVALALDGTQIDSRTADVPAGGTVEVNFTWAARLGDHTLSVRLDPRNLIAESDETNNNASVNVSVGRPNRPVAVIISPAEGQEFQEGQNITFDGSGSFVPDGGNLSWFSEQDGYLGREPVFNTTLPAGDHYITLYVDDGQSNDSAKVNFSVVPAPPPPATTWAVITSPRNGAVFTTVDRMTFDGSRSTAADAGYTLAYQWSSNQSGALGTTAKFTSTLPAGQHNITLKVDDGHGGVSNASVGIRVKEPPAAEAVISSPADGQSFLVTRSILFDASNSSSPGGAPLSYAWASNMTGSLGSQRMFWRSLPVGSHAITLEVSDGVGANGTATVNITVTETAVNHPPAVSIATPSDGATVRGVVNITGTASDDVNVSSVKVAIDNGTATPATGTTSWSLSWDTNTSAYPNGRHTIKVTAFDNAGLSTTATINVTVDNQVVKPPARPPGKAQDNTMLFIAIGVIVVVAAVGAAAFLLVRKK